ncbi:hypothetical protein [Methylobacterium sp. SD21]|uniref:hypothetical protein n=1 Tax=Methylobacterium litchii TaxID=3138810 RepID=UPI00313CB758
MTNEQIMAALTIFEAIRDYGILLRDLPGVTDEEKAAIQKVGQVALRKFQQRYDQ